MSSNFEVGMMLYHLRMSLKSLNEDEETLNAIEALERHYKGICYPKLTSVVIDAYKEVAEKAFLKVLYEDSKKKQKKPLKRKPPYANDRFDGFIVDSYDLAETIANDIETLLYSEDYMSLSEYKDIFRQYFDISQNDGDDDNEWGWELDDFSSHNISRRIRKVREGWIIEMPSPKYFGEEED